MQSIPNTIAGEASIRAVEAGNDLIAIGAHVGTRKGYARRSSDVVEAVRVGRIALERIDDSLERILRVKQRVRCIQIGSPLDPDLGERTPWTCRRMIVW